MTILEKVAETFQNTPVGTEFTTAEIKHLVYVKFGCNKASVIPSDYCYNKSNKGKIGALVDFNIFVYKKRGVYIYVGKHHNV